MAAKQRTHEQFLDDLDIKNPLVKRRHVKGTYSGVANKIYCECPSCGDDWYPLAGNLLRKIRKTKMCRTCSDINHRTELTAFQEDVDKKNELSNTFEIIHFTCMANEVTCKCLNCDDIFYMPNGYYLIKDSCVGACPTCYKPNNSPFTKTNLQARIDDVYGKDVYIWDGNEDDINKANKSLIRLACSFCSKQYKQTIGNLINHEQGCKCQQRKHKSEDRLIAMLKATIPNVEIVEQWRPEFLKTKNGQQSCDIYLPRYGIVIERQGEQHSRPVNWFKKDGCPDKAFEYNKKMDRRKRRLLKANGILQIDIPYFDFSTQHGIKRQSIFLQYFILFLAKQIKNRKLGVGGYRVYNQERFMKGVKIPVEARSLVV